MRKCSSVSILHKLIHTLFQLPLYKPISFMSGRTTLEFAMLELLLGDLFRFFSIIPYIWSFLSIHLDSSLVQCLRRDREIIPHVVICMELSLPFWPRGIHVEMVTVILLSAVHGRGGDIGLNSNSPSLRPRKIPMRILTLTHLSTFYSRVRDIVLNPFQICIHTL